MLPSNWLESLRSASVAFALCAVGSMAEAHTTVKSQATEGVRADNALKIGHGCEEVNPVIAQSVVFPTESPELSSSDPSVSIADLGEVIEQGGLAGLFSLIQDRSIFRLQDLKLDALGNAIGFHGRKGLLRIGLRGRVPFEFSGPNFLPESCATALRVELAVADICDASRPTMRPDKVNLWIPDNGSQFAIEALANGVEGVGAPPRLVVNRDLALNPLDASCNGQGHVVTVTPSAAQIDRDLPIARFWRLR
jgi:hypothetical protein